MAKGRGLPYILVIGALQGLSASAPLGRSRVRRWRTGRSWLGVVSLAGPREEPPRERRPRPCASDATTRNPSQGVWPVIGFLFDPGVVGRFLLPGAVGSRAPVYPGR